MLKCEWGKNDDGVLWLNVSWEKKKL